MDESSPVYAPAAPGGYPQLIPVATATTGGILLLIGVIQAISSGSAGNPTVAVALDLVFFGSPGATLLYTGIWMPRSDIDPEYHLRLVVWMLGGVVVMFGFIVLRDIHPGVSVDWSTGTQAIALTLGSIGGLLVWIQDSGPSVSVASKIYYAS